jgi:hypothetical protein
MRRRRAGGDRVFDRFVLPSHGAAEGIEGFAVATVDGRSVGRVAALNRAGAGFVILLEERAAARRPAVFRPLEPRFVVEIDIGRGAVLLTPDAWTALASAAAVTPRRATSDDEQLIRYLPTSLQRLVVAGPASEPSSWWWVVATTLIVLAGFTLLPVHFLIEHGSTIGWAAIAVPLALLGAAGWTMSTAADADRGSKIELKEKLATVPAFLLGSSPWPTKRR